MCDRLSPASGPPSAMTTSTEEDDGSKSAPSPSVASPEHQPPAPEYFAENSRKRKRLNAVLDKLTTQVERRSVDSSSEDGGSSGSSPNSEVFSPVTDRPFAPLLQPRPVMPLPLPTRLSLDAEMSAQVGRLGLTLSSAPGQSTPPRSTPGMGNSALLHPPTHHLHQQTRMHPACDCLQCRPSLQFSALLHSGLLQQLHLNQPPRLKRRSRSDSDAAASQPWLKESQQDSPLDLSRKTASRDSLTSSASSSPLTPKSADAQMPLPSPLPLPRNVSPVVEVSNSDVGYVCPVCGQMFSLHDRLAKHMASRHRARATATTLPGHADTTTASGGGRSYACDVCKRSFARSDMLTRHMRLHTGAKPYTCRACGQVFSRSDHLSTHQRTHTGEKPYRCPQCPYAACRRDMITRHMRTHARYDSALPDSSSASPPFLPLEHPLADLRAKE